MKAVNISVQLLFCCLEMTRLWCVKNIFFLTLGAPKKWAHHTLFFGNTYLCKYTEFDPKSGGGHLKPK